MVVRFYQCSVQALLLSRVRASQSCSHEYVRVKSPG
jgi:hypothetical protein